MSDVSVSNRVVTVACKLPHGIKIRDHVERTEFENVMGGGTRKVKRWRPMGKIYRIKGPNVPLQFLRLIEVVGGYAITTGIPLNIFERWLEWNKGSAMVRNHLIFGGENRDDVIAKAKEYESSKTGVEPLDTRMKKNSEDRLVFVDERMRTAGIEEAMKRGAADLDVSAA